LLTHPRFLRNPCLYFPFSTLSHVTNGRLFFQKPLSFDDGFFSLSGLSSFPSKNFVFLPIGSDGYIRLLNAPLFRSVGHGSPFSPFYGLPTTPPTFSLASLGGSFIGSRRFLSYFLLLPMLVQGPFLPPLSLSRFPSSVTQAFFQGALPCPISDLFCFWTS